MKNEKDSNTIALLIFAWLAFALACWFFWVNNYQFFSPKVRFYSFIFSVIYFFTLMTLALFKALNSLNKEPIDVVGPGSIFFLAAFILWWVPGEYVGLVCLIWLTILYILGRAKIWIGRKQLFSQEMKRRVN